MQIVFCFRRPNSAHDALPPHYERQHRRSHLYGAVPRWRGRRRSRLQCRGPCTAEAESGSQSTWKITSTDLTVTRPADTKSSALNSDESISASGFGTRYLWKTGTEASAGPSLIPPTDADGEGTPGRIYGLMAVTGNIELSPTLSGQAATPVSLLWGK